MAEFVSDGTKCSASPDHADILETIQNAADDWQKHGYPTALAEVRDMANVGRALMTAIADNAGCPPLKGWHPADCPSEIVSDLLNMLDDATRAATPAMDREAVEKVTSAMLIGRSWMRHSPTCRSIVGEATGDGTRVDCSCGLADVLSAFDAALFGIDPALFGFNPPLSTLSADAIRQGEGLDHKVAAFVADYEFRGDDGDFTPDSATKAIIEDAIHGFLALATPASHASDGGEANG